VVELEVALYPHEIAERFVAGGGLVPRDAIVHFRRELHWARMVKGLDQFFVGWDAEWMNSYWRALEIVKET